MQQAEGLTQNELARRLGCSPKRLIDRRSDAEELAWWTQNRDPEGRSWEFKDGRYYPIAP